MECRIRDIGNISRTVVLVSALLGVTPVLAGPIATGQQTADVDGTRMTVLVPNADAEARRDLPAAGDGARLSWSDENIHIVREGRSQSDPE